MNLDSPDDLTPDPLLRDALLGEALREIDRTPPLDVAALRLRVLSAAAPALAARRAGPSWWEVTSRAGRFLIPASLAAAALALILLRQAPAVGAAAELVATQTSSSIAYEVPDSPDALRGMSAESLMPDDADTWLLGGEPR